MTLQIGFVQFHPAHRGIVDHQGMEAAMPDDHRPFAGNAIDPLALHLAMPDGMVAPGKERLLRIAHAVFDLHQAVDEGVLPAHRGHLLPRQFPVHGGDEMHRQQQRRHGGMQMRIDEAGHDDLVREAFVDGVRMCLQPGAEAFQAADFDDPVAAHRHRRGQRQRRVHGVDRLRPVDLYAAVTN